MSDEDRYLRQERASYRDDKPCAVCGTRVQIQWEDDRRLSDDTDWFVPVRFCPNARCDTNGGTLGDPVP